MNGVRVKVRVMARFPVTVTFEVTVTDYGLRIRDYGLRITVTFTDYGYGLRLRVRLPFKIFKSVQRASIW
jgi:hypothetical protein